MTGNETPTPHDAFFKNIMGRVEIARNYIRYYLPAEITSQLDLDTLKVDTEGYVADDMKAYFSDIVAAVRLNNGQQSDIYLLFEHKSGLDKLTRLQVLKYMAMKWYRCATDKNLDHVGLPIIIPVVVYHGRRKWKYSLEFSDLFRVPSDAFRVYIPKFEHILHDLSHFDEEAFKVSVDVRVFLLLLKNIFNPKLGQELPRILSLLQELEDKNRITQYLPIIIKYILTAGKASVKTVKEAVKSLPRGEETVKTTADQLRKEGFNQGVLIGKQEGVLIGKQEGVLIGKQEGILVGEQKGIQTMLLEVLQDRFGDIHPDLATKIRFVESTEKLKELFRQALKLESVQEFIQEVDNMLNLQ